MAIGFAESVDFMLETDKTKQHKADGRMMSGTFFRYIWRSTECIVGTKDAAYKCRTIRRKTEDLAYDPKCVDSIKIEYNEYILKDARTSVVATRHPGPAEGPIDPVPTRGREFVPRLIYTRPADFGRHEYTQGCRGCA